MRLLHSRCALVLSLSRLHRLELQVLCVLATSLELYYETVILTLLYFELWPSNRFPTLLLLKKLVMASRGRFILSPRQAILSYNSCIPYLLYSFHLTWQSFLHTLHSYTFVGRQYQSVSQTHNYPFGITPGQGHPYFQLPVHPYLIYLHHRYCFLLLLTGFFCCLYCFCCCFCFW